MLDATLTVAPTPEGFELTLTVENAGGDPVTLSFSDGQRAEFAAELTDGTGGDDDGTAGGDDDEGWRWGAGRAFSMALGAEELTPGESFVRTATWPDPDPGEYEVRAWLTATDADASASTVVVVD